jgi:ParB-like chromosome segregation protein Spo0J
MIKLSKILPNPNNPRLIKDDRFKKLVNSIKEFPKMMELRPMVVDENFITLGGNMRLKALKELGYKEIPDEWVKQASDLTPEESIRFIIADNVGFGEHDWDMLANEWDAEQLSEWGLDIPDFNKLDNLQDGEEMEFEQSVQLIPPKEYILIMADPNSDDWEEMKELLQLKMVRRGGYKEGSAFDAVSLERVLIWENFKERYVNSSTK